MNFTAVGTNALGGKANNCPELPSPLPLRPHLPREWPSGKPGRLPAGLAPSPLPALPHPCQPSSTQARPARSTPGGLHLGAAKTPGQNPPEHLGECCFLASLRTCRVPSWKNRTQKTSFPGDPDACSLLEKTEMGKEEKAFEKIFFLFPRIVTKFPMGSQIFIQWPNLLRGQWLSALLGVGGCCSRGPEQGSPPQESLTALS